LLRKDGVKKRRRVKETKSDGKARNSGLILEIKETEVGQRDENGSQKREGKTDTLRKAQRNLPEGEQKTEEKTEHRVWGAKW